MTVVRLLLAASVGLRLVIAAASGGNGWAQSGTAAAASGDARGLPLRASATAVLDELDRAFSRGDEVGFLACFAPTAHRRPLQVWRARWHDLSQSQRPLHRRSQVARVFEAGRQTVAILDVEYGVVGDPHTKNSRQELAVLTEGLTPRLRLLVDCDADAVERLRARNGVFACPACAFTFEVPSGWLAAPSPAAGSLCLEALAFYHPALDFCLEVAVQEVPATATARSVLTAVVRDLDAGRPPTASGFADWKPGVGAGATPATDGARALLELPDRQRALLCAATRAGLSYLVAVYGSDAAFRALPDEAQRAVAGLSLLATTAPGDTQHDAAVAHHTAGGCLEGDIYTNDHYGVALPLPAGWTHVLRGEHLFTTVSTSVDGEARVAAYGPPRGFSAWSTVLATQLMLRGCGEWRQDASDSGWQEQSAQVSRRQCARATGAGEEGVLFLCAPHLLVVARWRATSAAGVAAVAAAWRGLTLR